MNTVEALKNLYKTMAGKDWPYDPIPTDAEVIDKIAADGSAGGSGGGEGGGVTPDVTVEYTQHISDAGDISYSDFNIDKTWSELTYINNVKINLKRIVHIDSEYAEVQSGTSESITPVIVGWWGTSGRKAFFSEPILGHDQNSYLMDISTMLLAQDGEDGVSLFNCLDDIVTL